jgi:transcriptional regulator with XRE-family HTH domain
MGKRIDAGQRLRAFVQRHDRQRDAAKALGISPQYLGDLLRGRRAFSDGMLKKLGLRMRRVLVEVR